MKWMTAIVAMGRNRVIGDGKRIPWHLPEDLKWFKEKTMGGALLMGRKTYESIGRPLPGRDTYVVSRGPAITGVTMIRNLAKFDTRISDRPFFVVGGAEIYRQTLDRCSELFVTLVDTEPEGEVRMPEFEDRFDLVEVVRHGEGYRILRYKNRAAVHLFDS
ncbi:MAG TPA: dihydrofolate reductase [Chthoniobacterales bacterium]